MPAQSGAVQRRNDSGPASSRSTASMRSRFPESNSDENVTSPKVRVILPLRAVSEEGGHVSAIFILC